MPNFQVTTQIQQYDFQILRQMLIYGWLLAPFVMMPLTIIFLLCVFSFIQFKVTKIMKWK